MRAGGGGRQARVTGGAGTQPSRPAAAGDARNMILICYILHMRVGNAAYCRAAVWGLAHSASWAVAEHLSLRRRRHRSHFPTL